MSNLKKEEKIFLEAEFVIFNFKVSVLFQSWYFITKGFSLNVTILQQKAELKLYMKIKNWQYLVIIYVLEKRNHFYHFFKTFCSFVCLLLSILKLKSYKKNTKLSILGQYFMHNNNRKLQFYKPSTL